MPNQKTFYLLERRYGLMSSKVDTVFVIDPADLTPEEMKTLIDFLPSIQIPGDIFHCVGTFVPTEDLLGEQMNIVTMAGQMIDRFRYFGRTELVEKALGPTILKKLHCWPLKAGI